MFPGFSNDYHARGNPVISPSIQTYLPPLHCCVGGLGVQGLGLGVQGLGLGVQGLGLSVQGLGLSVQGLGLSVQGRRVDDDDAADRARLGGEGRVLVRVRVQSTSLRHVLP